MAKDDKTKNLQLVRERKIKKLFKKREIGSIKKFEASGILIHPDGQLYVVFDSLWKVARLSNTALDKNSKNRLIGIEEIHKDDSSFEGITWSNIEKTFYIVIESREGTEKDKFFPVIVKCDKNLNFIEQCPVDLTDDLKSLSSNKGFEGLTCLEVGNDFCLLGLCEGNFCKGGDEGRVRGGGTIHALKKNGDKWEINATIRLPKKVKFIDYSDLDIYRGNRIAVVSQESSKLWIGRLTDAERNDILKGNDITISDQGKTYNFPKAKYDSGKPKYLLPGSTKAESIDCAKKMTAYCNVEGISWIDANRIAVVSDRRKKKGQEPICAGKDQSIHVFDIPD